jgi:hypothetical protein
LQVWQAQQDKPGEAPSLSVLADFAVAAREIRASPLRLKEAWRSYNALSGIAPALSDTSVAAEWAQKRDDLRAELERRTGGSGALPAKMVQALQQLAIACAHAGFGDARTRPGRNEALAKLDGYPVPFPDFVAYLRQLAASQLPPIPTSLPAELREFLEPLAQAIRESWTAYRACTESRTRRVNINT